MMQRSEQVGELITVLAKAQSEFTFASKDSTNPAFNSKYADLAANIIAVRPILSKHGIAILQFDEADVSRQTASVTTALHHGEQWMSVTAEAPATGVKGFNVQSIGACWTYLRRYTLQAVCGLASDDDDGNSLAVDNKPVAKVPIQPERIEEMVASIVSAPNIATLMGRFDVAFGVARHANDSDAIQNLALNMTERMVAIVRGMPSMDDLVSEYKLAYKTANGMKDEATKKLLEIAYKQRKAELDTMPQVTTA